MSTTETSVGSTEATELRVHGVGGTRPDSILEDPHLRRVSGDDLIGFYRPASDRGAPHSREAVSWGKITAGDAGRALWVLLLPFALANLAGWTHPPATNDGDWDARTREKVIKRLVRIFGLTMTLGATLMTANLFLDLVAYQCGGVAECRTSKWWVGVFRWSYLREHPAPRLAVGSLLCLAALGFLLWVSRASYKAFEEYEQATTSGSDAESGSESTASHPADVGLQHRDFWRGGGPVGQLRDLHAAAALAAIASILAYAVAPLSTGAQRALVLAVFAAGCLVILVAAGALVTDERIYRRPDKPRRHRYRWLKRLGYGLVLASLAIAFLVKTDDDPWQFRLTPLDQINQAFFISQGTLLLLLFGLQAWRAWRLRKTLRGESKPAFHGMAAFAICALALFILSSASAGAVVRLADLLGEPVIETAGCPKSDPGDGSDPPPRLTDEAEPETIICYAQYHQKTAIVALIVLIALLLIAFRVARWLNVQASVCRKEVINDLRTSGWDPPEALSDETEGRIRQVAKSYALSTLVLNADSLLLRVILIGSGIALFQHFAEWTPGLSALAEYLSTESFTLVQNVALFAASLAVLIAAVAIPVGEQPSACGEEEDGKTRAPKGNLSAFCILAIALSILSLGFVKYPLLTNGAAWAVTLLPVALAAGLYGGLRNPNLRRSIGVVWDVITFWPRHFHPFAPPCYGERLVPQLKYRLENLTVPPGGGPGGRVLVSAHSQGSVVAVAALLQVSPESCRRIALFTYGSPLEILYRRLFPAYFGGDVIGAVEKKLLPGNIRVPWRHFFCRTDPLGVPMSQLTGTVDDSTMEPVSPDDPAAHGRRTNTHLLDPHTWETVIGEPPWPLRRHSAYLSHPVFLENVDVAVRELGSAPEVTTGSR